MEKSEITLERFLTLDNAIKYTQTRMRGSLHSTTTTSIEDVNPTNCGETNQTESNPETDDAMTKSEKTDGSQKTLTLV